MVVRDLASKYRCTIWRHPATAGTPALATILTMQRFILNLRLSTFEFLMQVLKRINVVDKFITDNFAMMANMIECAGDSI